MADFVAVLRKTLDGIDSPTPEMRQKVYAKARTTIAAKLEAINPKPPQNVIERQMAALETAISDVEAAYKQSKSFSDADDDPLAEFVSGAAFGTPVAAKPAMPAPAQTPVPEAIETATSVNEPVAASVEPKPAAVQKGTGTTAEKTRKPSAPLPGSGSAGARKRSNSGLIAAAIVLLLLAGAGYGVWQNKEDFAEMVGLGHLFASGDTAGQGEMASADDGTPADDERQEQAATDGGSSETAGASTEAAEEDEPKFTQRLMADGTEVDQGPAGDEPTVGEGTSVAAATAPADGGNDAGAGDGTGSGADNVTGAEPPTGDNAEASGETASATGAQAPEITGVPVGQRAIFYEERTSDLQGSAQTGAVVWSVVQESPGGNLPAEAAIRAEATIPGKNIQFHMTIRRNGDETLPASHIIEMVFITPDDFDGGAIENVLRIAFKDTEQSAGNPLLGIPAKISDGFFLLALTDSKADIEANTTMMRRQEWLDVPIVYSSGRRALITMEKGVPGNKAFDEALKAWAQTSSG